MARRGLRVDLVHWMPVEMYPPTMNLARELAGRGWQVRIHTTHNRHGLREFEGNGIEIRRAASPVRGSSFGRAWSYAGFHLGTARRLAANPPDAVMYFEPQSSFPVLLATKARHGLPVFIHHHEYHEPAEFLAPGMRLARLFHDYEKRVLFPRARWISHTNEARLELFLADNGEDLRGKSRILRNLPPREWGSEPNRAWTGQNDGPFRMVYVGSLSCGDTYIEACTRWILAQPPHTVTLDVYAYNADDETREFLKSVEGPAIRFHQGGVPYDELPNVLRGFHAGLILYRARTLNYRHNASNKLFEYLACGLDALYPPTMRGVKQYERSDAAPRVIEVDFEAGNIDLAMLASRDGLPAAAYPGTASTEIERLADALTEAASTRE
ncbi:MAG: glycosyltransferase [Gemmatimonadales bacterium]